MAETLTTLAFGAVGYFLVQFAISPILRIMTLRQEMHEAILQYGNIWGIDQNDSEYSQERIHNAREKYRKLAARGIAEYENLSFNNLYFLAKIYLCATDIKLKEASEKFWAMESDAAQPDGSFRKKIEAEIRGALNLPQNKKNLDVKEVA